LEQFLNIAILGGADADLTDEEEDYVFTDSGMYYIPCLDGDKGLEVLQNYCNGLPMHDQPEIFGMHSNADVVYRHQQGSQILNLALKVRGGSSGLGGSSEQPKEELAEDADRRIAAQLLEDIPPTIASAEVNPALLVPEPGTALISCMASFLLHEMNRFGKLLLHIRESLTNVQGALSGLLVMSQELDTVSACLRQNSVPHVWHALAYPSRKSLGNWVVDLQQRVSFIRAWSTMISHPPCFWLSYFFFPQGFLTGVLQSFSRRHGLSIDTLVFKHKVRSEVCDASEIYSGPEEGVYTFGPFMEGGRWDIHSQQIEDCRPGEMFSSMPVIHFLPVGERDYIEDLDAEGGLLRYACPLYKTTARAGELSTTGQSTNFVCSVLLPTTVSPNSWVLKGVALICALDE
jgi:dynein heavy chain